MSPPVADDGVDTIATPGEDRGAAGGARAASGISAARGLTGVFVATYVLVCAPFVGHVPIWDALAYTTCLGEAARSLTLRSVTCWNHPSIVWGTLLALVQRLAPGPASLIGMDVAAGVVGILGFARLLAVVPGTQETPVVRALVVGAFALNPSWIASTIHTNFDFPVVAALPWLVWALLVRRWGIAAAVGAGMVFTKESGVLVYAAAAALYVLLFVTAAPDLEGRARRRRLAAASVLLLPLAAFVAYLAVRARLDPGGPLLNRELGPSVRYLLALDLGAPPLHAYLATALVLNFAWLLGLVAVAGGVAGALRGALGWRPARSEEAKRGRYVGWLCLVLCLILTRVPTFNNPRYYLAILPCLVVVAAVGVARGVRSSPLRVGYWVTVVSLFAASIAASLDPVSRAVFGTFPFGARRLFAMTSVTGECCGAGRDQLVYNVEFTWISRLLRDALRALDPEPRLVVRSADLFYLNTWARVAGFGATPASPGPRFTDVSHLLEEARLPPTVWQVEFPASAGGAREEEDRLGSRYRRTGERRVRSVLGYELVVARWDRRPDEDPGHGDTGAGDARLPPGR